MPADTRLRRGYGGLRKGRAQGLRADLSAVLSAVALAKVEALAKEEAVAKE